MPKEIAATEYEPILAAVARFAEGGSTNDIGAALGATIGRRTLQRRLAELVAAGRLLQAGRGPSTRYSVPEAPPPQPDAGGDASQPLQLSESGADVRRLVRAAIHERPPVGYNRAFLEAYQPGATWYLTDEMRRHLRNLGTSWDRDHVAGTYARQLYERLLIDLAWNSSRLEGNTYSLLETARLLETGEAAAGKDAAEAQMILNHKAAIDLLVGQAERVGFNRYTILNLHALLADNLLPDPQAGGRLRATAVEIHGSSFHPLELPQLIDECFGMVLSKAAAIPEPLEQAFFALVHLPYLQPFLDVNKRVSRLAANLPLIRGNLCPLSFLDVPTQDYIDGLLGIYERNRMELLRDVFCWAYERSCARYSVLRQTLGQPDRFRQRHRAHIAATIRHAVRGRLGKQAAADYIHRQAQALPEPERPKFIEMVETDLLNLHEGNIATAQLSPQEFHAWRKGWVAALGDGPEAVPSVGPLPPVSR